MTSRFLSNVFTHPSPPPPVGEHCSRPFATVAAPVDREYRLAYGRALSETVLS